MESRGPTQGAAAIDADRQWQSRPAVAAALRVLILVLPIAAAVIFVWAFGRLLPAERLGVHRWLWMTGVFLASNLVVIALSALTRKATPLVALMKLTLVFPDNAPSRSKAALRRSSSRAMLRELEDAKRRGTSEVGALQSTYVVQLLKEINEHDRLTRGHSERVRAYAEMIGEELQLAPDEMNKLRWAALLHDAGKLAVPAGVLNKAGRPTDEEWQILSTHPEAGAVMLEPLRPWLGEWIHAADEHHCRWDGTGYPSSLSGAQISLAGRIVAVADAYDVMTSTRSYKQPLSHQVARQELTNCAGSQFDPAIVRTFLQISLGRLRVVGGPFAGLVNLLGSAQAPLPVAGSAASSAGTAAAAAVAFTAAGVGGLLPGSEAPPVVEQAEPAVLVAGEVELALLEDTAGEAILTVEGAEGSVQFNVGVSAHGTSSVGAPVEIAPGRWEAAVWFTPEEDFHGVEEATFEACDDLRCASGLLRVEVAAVNDAPVAANDRVAVDNGEVATFDVAANDIDVDGDALRVVEVLNPANGTAQVVDNRIRYEPHDGFEGVETIEYVVADSSGARSIALLIIVVGQPDALPPLAFSEPVEDGPAASIPVNLAPVVTGESLMIGEDSLGEVDVLANDVDPDGDALRVVSVSAADHGLVDIVADKVYYLPDPNFFGTDVFTYRVFDGVNAPAAGTVAVTVYPVNDPPIVVSPGAQAGGVGTPFSLQIEASNVEGGSLSYTASGLPAGLGISGTGLISGAPAVGTVGSHDVTIAVTDSESPAETVTTAFALDVDLHVLSPDAGTVTINEVLYETVSVVAPEEFVELHNRSASPVDLSGWRLQDANVSADGVEDLDMLLPATDHWGAPSVLAPGAYAVVWLVHDGVNLPPLVNPAGGLEFVVGAPGEKLADAGDDLWLIDASARVVDYVAYGGGTEVGTAPTPDLGLWDDTYQAALLTGGPTSIVVTPDGGNADTSACWEPTSSDAAAGRCPGAAATFDADAMPALATSVGSSNHTPAADAGGPYSIAEGDAVTLDGTASIGPVVQWKWDLDNDGSFDDASTSTPTVPWAALEALGLDDDGVYPIALQVNGGADVAATTLTITNVVPSLSVTGGASVSAGASYTVTLAAVDPGADAITSWTINWGDGSIETIAGDPSTASHVYTGAGHTFGISVSATDEDGTYFDNDLLVPDFASDSFFRVAADSQSISQQVATGDDRAEAIIGPDGYVYVSGENDSSVLRYDAITGAYVDDFVPSGTGGLNGAEGLAFGPGGDLYVGSWSTNDVRRYDGATGAFVSVFATVGISDPYDLVFGPNGNLFVGTYSANEVLEFDGATGAPVGTFVSPSSGGLDSPEQLVFGPDGHLYVASLGSAQVLRYDGATGAFLDVFVAAGGAADLQQPAGMAFGPDGNLYVAEFASGDIERFDGATGVHLETYLPGAPGGITTASMMTFVPSLQVTVS